MPSHRTNTGRKREQGIIITLVAIFMLFVVGAMAALSIDVVTFYTARSEAQLAADGAALAAARVLANSGMTSSGGTTALPFPVTAAEALATSIATQVAQQNQVEGGMPQVVVSFNDSAPQFSNPHVTVQVKRTDLPTFFARIWGSTTITVAASATAEAYNPSGLVNGTTASLAVPVAPTCVKPWLLPNIDPNNSPNPIFDPTTGVIQDYNLLGLEITTPPGLQAACSDCSGGLPTPTAWQYYPGDPGSSFPPPSATSVACSGSGGFTSYQLGIAGCVQTPISCNAKNINIDTSSYGAGRSSDTSTAVNCLAHSSASGGGDSINTGTNPTPAPFEFLAGADNPIVQIRALQAGTDVMVSDSLVTVPVFDCGPAPCSTISPSPNLVGFVQLFLNPDGNPAPVPGSSPPAILTTVINMVGCGTNTSGTPVYGNGPSAVPVRLITPP